MTWTDSLFGAGSAFEQAGQNYANIKAGMTPEQRAAEEAAAASGADAANKKLAEANQQRDFLNFLGGVGGQANVADPLINNAVQQAGQNAARTSMQASQLGLPGTGSYTVTDRWGAQHQVPLYNAGVTQDPNAAANKINLAAQLAAINGRRPITGQASQLGGAASMNAAQLGPAAQIAMGPQDQFRGQQNWLSGLLGAGAMGLGPSAAQAQLQQATGRNMSQALSMALAARGGTQGAALKQAGMQRALISQDAGLQSAQLRAQEMQAAQQAMGGVLAQGRGADIGLATDQAGLQQQRMMQQGAFNQQAAGQNASFQQQQMLQQGAMNQQMGIANLDALMQQQRQKDDLVARYLGMGIALDQASYMADLQQKQFNAGLLSNQVMGYEGINTGANSGTAAALGQGLNAIGGIVATGVNAFGGGGGGAAQTAPGAPVGQGSGLAQPAPKWDY